MKWNQDSQESCINLPDQFFKNKEKIKRIKETRDSRYIDQNERDIACFQLDMAYRDFKDLPKRTNIDKELRDKAFIAKNKSKIWCISTRICLNSL